MIVGLAVLVSQLGGAGGGAPLNAVAAAAVRTQEEAGGRAVLHGVVSTASGKSIAITGREVFDAENRARAVLAIPAVGSDPASSMEMIGDGAVIYMRSPKLTLPAGKKWMKIDLESAIGLKVPAPAESDPRAELALLETAGNVRKLGREDVRGVPTTRYRGTIGIAATAARLRELGETELADKFEKEGSPLRFDVWIGSGGLVRRLQVRDLRSSSGSAETSTDMTMDLFDFGLEPRIEVPDAGEVFDATSLAESSQ